LLTVLFLLPNYFEKQDKSESVHHTWKMYRFSKDYLKLSIVDAIFILVNISVSFIRIDSRNFFFETYHFSE